MSGDTTSSFYSSTPNYATSYPTQNDTNTEPLTGNTQAPSSFYPNGSQYATLANADTLTAEIDADVANAYANAQSAYTSAQSAYTSAQNAAAAVQAAAGTALPIVDGTATVGTSTLWAHQDHIHPTDTTRAPTASPTFTGTVTIPTPTAGDNSTTAASTAFVATSFAPLSFLQAGTGAVARTVSSKLTDTVSVKDFGATGNGSTDDTAAIQAALNSGARAVYVPAATYRCASGLTVPNNTTLYGESVNATSPTPLGSCLIFDLTVATCLTVGVSGQTSTGVRNLTVTRASGTPASTTIGVYVQASYNVVLENVNSFSHGIGFYFKGGATGISAMSEKLFTGAIQDAHVVIDSWPESRFSECRFGSNGTADAACTAYIRVTGGNASNASGGTNTGDFAQCQFNQGNSQKVTNLIEFVNQTPSNIGDMSTWRFTGNHVEQCHGIVKTDSTWPSLINLFFAGNDFNFDTEFWTLNAATTVVKKLHFVGNFCGGSPFTLGGGTQVLTDTVFAGNTFDGFATFTGSGASTLSMAGNAFTGGISIAGAWSECLGNDLYNLGGGGYHNTATGAFGFGTINGVDGHALNGQGSTYDLTLKNNANNKALGIPTGTLNVRGFGSITSSSASGGIGYMTGAGGTVTQATSRTTGVTLNTVTGAITLVSAAGSATYQSFTVTNSSVVATDIIQLSQKSGTDKYILLVTAVAAGSFQITYATTGGTTTEQPVFNFAVIKGVTA
jgi:hypothetical protein